VDENVSFNMGYLAVKINRRIPPTWRIGTARFKPPLFDLKADLCDRGSIAARYPALPARPYRPAITAGAAPIVTIAAQNGAPLSSRRPQMNKLLATALLATLCSAAHALPAQAPDSGFLTGEYFRGGSPSLRTAYVIGVLDGFSYAHAFGAPVSKTSKLQTCMAAMHADARQLGDVVDQYLDAHHELWGEKMQPIGLRAMRATTATHGVTID